MYDSRLGNWLSLDPVTYKYPELSPYAYCANNPILFYDKAGKEFFISIYYYNYVAGKGSYTTVIYRVNESDIDSDLVDIYREINNAINYLGKTSDPVAKLLYEMIANNEFNVVVKIDSKTWAEPGLSMGDKGEKATYTVTNTGEVIEAYSAQVQGLLTASTFFDMLTGERVAIQSPAVFPLSHEIGHAICIIY